MQAWSLQRAQLGRYATIEAEYYLPSRLQAQHRMESLPPHRRMPLAALCDPGRRITYGVLKPKEVVHSHARMARIQNAEHGFIDPESLPYIDDSQFDEYARSEVVEGDLVIAIFAWFHLHRNRYANAAVRAALETCFQNQPSHGLDKLKRLNHEDVGWAIVRDPDFGNNWVLIHQDSTTFASALEDAATTHRLISRRRRR